MSEQEHAPEHGAEPTVPLSPAYAAGKAVYDLTGARLGVVSKASVPGYLVVSRGLFFKHDVYLPLAAVGAQERDAVYLRYTKDELLGRDWGAMATKQPATAVSLAEMADRPPKEEMQRQVKDEGRRHDAGYHDGPLPG